MSTEMPPPSMKPALWWNTREVTLGTVSYPYGIGIDCLDRIGWEVGRYEADRLFVVTDDTVLALHGERLVDELVRYAPVEVLSLPAGEAMKTMSVLSRHAERALQAGASRRSAVIAFGGGVPGNLGGMLAAVLLRGLRLVHVPTTTVAAMDSVISLKQAINSTTGKNHLGTYYAPQAVCTDLRLLQTLPERELRSGLCEAAKNCLAIAPASLAHLRGVLDEGDLAGESTLLWLLEESLATKSLVTAGDAREQRSGLVLEYGHTVGHAVELCDHRLRGVGGLSHGEAVAFGMVVAARVAAALGLLDREDVDVHDELVRALGAPLRLPAGLSVSDVMHTIRADNKRGYLDVGRDDAAMVLLGELGRPLWTSGRPLVAAALDLVEDVICQLMTPAGTCPLSV